MKGLIYYRVNKDNIANSGVIKKCYAQATALRQLGVDIDLVLLSDKGILLNDQLLHTFSSPILAKRFSTYSFYFFKLLPILFSKIDIKKYQFLYFRYALAHPALIKSLKKIHQEHPSIKVFAEMPTYPYEKEKLSLVDKLSLQMDQYYRKKLVNYLHAFTHYGLEKEIYGVPTIAIRNGINTDNIKISKAQTLPNTIRLIAVANWSYWHGLDRLIEGFKNYYSDSSRPFYKITLTVIGNGKSITIYQELVKTHDLQHHIIFLPPMTNEQLNVYFDQSDIGVGTLGIHRKAIAIDSSLKHREYCARGLPLMLAGNDLDFQEQLPFVLKVSSNDEAIDLKNVIDFFAKNIIKGKVTRKEIRTYAEEQLRWESKMRDIIHFS